MNHEACQAQLSALLDGELSDAEKDAVLAHLEQCPDCRARLEELTAMHEAFGGWEEYEAPEGFAEGVMERVRAEKQSRKAPWTRYAAVAACAAVALLAIARLPGMFGGGSFPVTGMGSAAPPAASGSTAYSMTTDAPMAAEAATEEAAENGKAAPSAKMASDYGATETPQAAAAAPEMAMLYDAGVNSAAAETEESRTADAEERRYTAAVRGEEAWEWVRSVGRETPEGGWEVSAALLRELPEGTLVYDGDTPPEDYEGYVTVYPEVTP